MKSEILRSLTAALALSFMASLQAVQAEEVAPVKARDESTSSDAIHAFKSFLDCDASFFDYLKNNLKALGENVSVAERGFAAAPVVENPLDENKRQQSFAPNPLVMGRLSLTAWHNEVSYYNFNRPKAYLFWGFTAEGTVDDVAVEINKLLPGNKRLSKVDNVWAYAEHKRAVDPSPVFKRGGISGVVTPEGLVEKVLLVGKAGDLSTPTTKIYCTLQGSLTPALLKALRPDLLESEYP